MIAVSKKKCMFMIVLNAIGKTISVCQWHYLPLVLIWGSCKCKEKTGSTFCWRYFWKGILYILQEKLKIKFEVSDVLQTLFAFHGFLQIFSLDFLRICKVVINITDQHLFFRKHLKKKNLYESILYPNSPHFMVCDKWTK